MSNRRSTPRRLNKVTSVLGVPRIPRFSTKSEICNFVTDAMMDKYDLSEPSRINNGYCFIWAYLVGLLWPDNVRYVTNDNHVVLFDPKSGLYHDAENPEGTKILNDIDWMSVGGETVSSGLMIYFWGHVGLHKHELRELVAVIEPRSILARLKGASLYTTSERESMEPNYVFQDWKELTKNFKKSVPMIARSDDDEEFTENDENFA